MRKYNNNISERANESLRKRELVVRIQKRMLAIVIILLIALGILLGSGMKTLASSNGDPSNYNKYYKSVRVEYGDTLWTMADEYISELDIDKSDYIEELCSINNIDGDELVAGEYIIVSYYSKEVK